VAEEEYAATLRRLYGLRRFGMRPGLATIQALLKELDDPQQEFRTIHIAGSKGKGSTAAMAASILSAAGRKTGLFTSPHLASFRERIRIDGVPMDPEYVVDGVQRIDAATEALERRGGLEHPPTFFEVTTALGFLTFANEGVTDAVIEVGLGGRLDSTNVLTPSVGVITTIELEHTDLLGPTLADIAREKAGILKPGQHAVLGALPPSARAEIDRRAYTAGIPAWHLEEEVRVTERSISEKGQNLGVELPHRTVGRLKIPLHGTFQPGNAALAVAAVDRHFSASGTKVSGTAVRKGLAKVVWRGRLERLERSPDLFLDVAHTPGSARALAQSLAEIAPMAPPAETAIVFGCLAEKRIPEILEALAPLGENLIAVPVATSRSATAAEIRRLALGRFPRVVEAPDAASGLRLARAATGPDGYTLVVGSDYLIGEILRQREGVATDEPDLSDPGVATPDAVPSDGTERRAR
jgi:dihydrofolate synthase/folylpolyglutamate synthase